MTMMRSLTRMVMAAAVLFMGSSAFAFAPPRTTTVISRATATAPSVSASTTSLEARRWNFNDGRGPFGLKNNAEIWNGRVAQMGFILVLLQELITGKGVVAGIQDGDVLSYALLGGTVVTVLGLTAFLAIKGDDGQLG
uniref:Uncharacterized protein n=1 Tax=Attheya septentrionalis TaxID=420275 RepID=A0A7S2U6K9_9STRA|mmetsp:Transcript_12598/g.22828  ORF Transcript_12598/g.22828 Transcript_12598/m.22828 type:complete len:138 (+) Transcript_12598:114-527(+)|eukprot:CAMPEP_0198285550 /NCGR_PEP_ID=MMETSP1449-20131203/4810_1 /TAXON_ID=420275 /ORGANISM="Attheya septentrionalis, Strain CCMP2084" /LENGTH=137 /DNA_ID=CAMNT_0043983003 /DNA_START=94 /DNA_END=507 /DNA_ORIENTATION=-